MAPQPRPSSGFAPFAPLLRTSSSGATLRSRHVAASQGPNVAGRHRWGNILPSKIVNNTRASAGFVAIARNMKLCSSETTGWAAMWHRTRMPRLNYIYGHSRGGVKQKGLAPRKRRHASSASTGAKHVPTRRSGTGSVEREGHDPRLVVDLTVLSQFHGDEILQQSLHTPHFYSCLTSTSDFYSFTPSAFSLQQHVPSASPRCLSNTLSITTP